MRIVARESPIGGTGVFTIEGCSVGEVICEFKLVRHVTRESPLRPELGELPEHCGLFDGRFYLVAAPERYLNHSCDPNAYLRFGPDGIGGIVVVALRDIPAGGEVTIDYLINNGGGDSWPCHCGVDRCRGETGLSFFTLPQEIQREYLGLLAPWFRRRYAEEVERLESASGL
jgi:SET domain-containing protein